MADLSPQGINAYRDMADATSGLVPRESGAPQGQFLQLVEGIGSLDSGSTSPATQSGGLGSLVGDFFAEKKESLVYAEAMAEKAVYGTADPVQVADAVTRASIDAEMATKVIGRVFEAYQGVLRMQL